MKYSKSFFFALANHDLHEQIKQLPAISISSTGLVGLHFQTMRSIAIVCSGTLLYIKQSEHVRVSPGNAEAGLSDVGVVKQDVFAIVSTIGRRSPCIKAHVSWVLHELTRIMLPFEELDIGQWHIGRRLAPTAVHHLRTYDAERRHLATTRLPMLLQTVSFGWHNVKTNDIDQTAPDQLHRTKYYRNIGHGTNGIEQSSNETNNTDQTTSYRMAQETKQCRSSRAVAVRAASDHSRSGQLVNRI